MREPGTLYPTTFSALYSGDSISRIFHSVPECALTGSMLSEVIAQFVAKIDNEVLRGHIMFIVC